MAGIRITRIASSAEMRPVLLEFQERIDLVTMRAFEHFVNRGCQHGRDLDDWLEAEREILGANVAAVEETQAGFRVKVALSGFGSHDIQVITGPKDLVVRAGRSGEAGALQAIRYPAAVDVAGIRGSFRGGILTIQAPRIRRHASARTPVSQAPPPVSWVGERSLTGGRADTPARISTGEKRTSPTLRCEE